MGAKHKESRKRRRPHEFLRHPPSTFIPTLLRAGCRISMALADSGNKALLFHLPLFVFFPGNHQSKSGTKDSILGLVHLEGIDVSYRTERAARENENRIRMKKR